MFTPRLLTESRDNFDVAVVLLPVRLAADYFQKLGSKFPFVVLKRQQSFGRHDSDGMDYSGKSSFSTALFYVSHNPIDLSPFKTEGTAMKLQIVQENM